MLRPRLLTLLTILAIAAATTATPGSAHQALYSRTGSRAESGRYVVRAIRGLDGKSVDVVGMDRRGDIVGTMHGRRSSAFVVVGGRLIKLGVPHGYRDAFAVDINQSGLISAQASKGRKRSFPFVIILKGGHFRWIPLPSGPGRVVSVNVGDIASNGDVAGTVWKAVGSRRRRMRVERAVVWDRSVARDASAGRGYGPPRALQLSRGYHSSSAYAVWSSRGRLIVAGWQAGSRSATYGRLTLWSPAPAVMSSTSGTGLPVVSHLGGWGKNIFAAGRFVGVDTSYGWKARIAFGRHHRARFASIDPLRTPYSCVESIYGANSVSAGAGGRFVGVGSIGCLSNQRPSSALIWRGSEVSTLQTLLPRSSGWRLESADAVSRRGQIAGTGRFRDRERIFLLTPR
jgi:hypothetical protein